MLRSHIGVSLILILVLAALIPFSSANASSQAPSISTVAVNYDYRNYSDIKDDLLGIELQHPDIAEVYDIGNSYEKVAGSADRDILAIKISDNVTLEEDEPEVLIVGLHHAREWTTSELVLEIADNLTDRYRNDTRISWLVDNREVWIVPVVNPDGLDYSMKSDQWWRKNRRPNYDGSYGVDLNRNYAGSMNGDPAGNWGGAGSSHVPSDETYCGQTPFSEPETQAIRSLVMAHDFQIALDFHSYGQLVLWPWGYTSAVAPDNADLVRIGNEFADLNGYTAEQSIGLYPTTGDSLDWMYGGEGVYAFCFEVGLEFHPAKTDDVLGIINNNLPPAMLGIEIAGDREGRPFQIFHTALAERNFSASGFTLSADVTAARGVNVSSLAIKYRVDNGVWSSVQMTLSSGNDTYSGVVPSAPVGSMFEYYFVARDSSGVELMAPRYAPYETYSFLVTDENPASPLEVIFVPPTSVDGSAGSQVSATARNVSAGSGLVLHLRNASLAIFENLSMTESPPTTYVCSIPALLPLADYGLWLTVESGGVVEWSSALTALTVMDGSPPVFLGHSATQIAPDQLWLEVNCTDSYGVESVDVTHREQGSSGWSSDAMALIRGNATNGTWGIIVEILSASVIEYNFTAADSNQSVADPSDGGSYEFSPVIVPEFPVAILVIAALAMMAGAAVLSRARRS